MCASKRTCLVGVRILLSNRDKQVSRLVDRVASAGDFGHPTSPGTIPVSCVPVVVPVTEVGDDDLVLTLAENHPAQRLRPEPGQPGAGRVPVTKPTPALSAR